MFTRPTGTGTISFGYLCTALAIALLLLAIADAAEASPRAQAPAPAPAGIPSEPADAARIRRYWTPQRMASARPLSLVVGRSGEPSLRLGRPAPTASASFLAVKTPEAPPYSVNGRIFIRIRGQRGYCSGTAIDSPTRQLVLTAGHCVNAGAVYRGNLWYRDLLFVPAYTAGRAPFGAFAARRSKIFAAPQWTNHSNSDFDVGAFLTSANNQGVNLADAVGGGAAIALDLPRNQRFASFGYPGNVQRMQGCNSSYIGDDRSTFRLPGPPTLGIGCHWAPGASGGGWLIEGGTQINGLNSYLLSTYRTHTYSPYFSQETVGKLVEGL
jgi:hypothetical protein